MQNGMAGALDGAIKDYLSTIERLKKEIKDRIMAFSDNPRIRRISNAPRCFTIMFSDPQGNWSPAFHDFKLQHQLLGEILDETLPDNILNKLTNIIQVGTYKKGERKYQFHPEVRKELAVMLYGEEKGLEICGAATQGGKNTIAPADL